MRRPTVVILLAAMLAGCGQSRPAATITPIDTDDIALNNRGVALMGHFDYPGAHSAFRAAVERQPNWYEAKINLAIATLNRQQEGDERAALALVGEVLANDGDNLRAHYVSGLLKLYLGEHAEAATHFETVLAGDPADAYASYYLGQCRVQAGDVASGLALFERAAQSDPYLRSAYYGAAQALRRLGRVDEAADWLDQYRRLADNPRARLAEFKYTRMGPRAETLTVDLHDAPASEIPRGAVFTIPVAYAELEKADAVRSLTSVDIDRNGVQDIFLTSGTKSQLFLGREDSFDEDRDSPLVGIGGANAVAWGDIDNDGLVDAYFCRDGPNQLWQQTAVGVFEDITAASKTADGRRRCVDVQLLDADHDGDLDIVIANANGSHELLSNNADGTFRALAGENGLEFGGVPGRSVLATDIDRDRDVDLLFINQVPPHDVLINDRLWRYRSAEGIAAFSTAPLSAAVANDADADGQTELYSLRADGALERWQPDADGIWSATLLGETEPSSAVTLEANDFNGDGRIDLLVLNDRGVALYSLARIDEARAIFEHPAPFGAAAGILADVSRGPGLAAIAETDDDAELWYWAPGPGRGAFATFTLTGKEESADSMRSNRSGIGTRVAIRRGSEWSVAELLDNSSGPGQSLQPLVFGLGAANKADYIAVNWSDGVFQTELDLNAGVLHGIAETQRQLSSCPVVFAWDGERFAFVSDILGVGGLGFLIEPGRYATPRPWENFLLPESLPVPRAGRLELKIAEPMEELALIDRVTLTGYDLAPGWSMVLDERMGTGEPQVSGSAIYYRRELLPQNVHDGGGVDITDALRAADLRAADPGPVDARFIGRLAHPFVITLEFDRPLDAQPGNPYLVADGWVEYPYSQTIFASWQAGAHYEAPTLEAASGDGPWQVVHANFGYPAGMPRRMALPLAAIGPKTTRLRLTSNLQLYWDRLAVVYGEAPGDQVQRITLSPARAQVAESGYPLRSVGPQRQPDYDYEQRAPLWDTRHPEGHYTEFGSALALVERDDDAFAIIGPGDELALAFDAPASAADGWRRRYVLTTRGYAKDMDLYTEHSGTVGPLPGVRDAEAERLHATYNTRYRVGY